MKEIQLSEKNNNMHVDYAPVVISENISIESSQSVRNGSLVIEGVIKKGEDSLGRFVMDNRDGRLFLNARVEGLKNSTKKDITETVASIIMKLMPEDEAVAES